MIKIISLKSQKIYVKKSFFFAALGCIEGVLDANQPLDCDSSSQNAGLEEFASLMLAVYEINKGLLVNGLKSPILDPLQYQLVVSNYSDFATQRYGLLGALNLMQSDDVSVIVGSDWSSVSKVIALVTGMLNTPQISGSSTSNLLSSKL